MTIDLDKNHPKTMGRPKKKPEEKTVTINVNMVIKDKDYFFSMVPNGERSRFASQAILEKLKKLTKKGAKNGY